MRNLLVATVGFLIGSAAVVAVAVALPTGGTAGSSTRAPMTQAMSGGMGSGMMGAAAANTAAKAQLVSLTIQHVQRGCHVWSNGKTTAATMRLHMKVGEKLSIRDMDVDAHQMMEFSGPMHLQMGGPMMMSRSMTLSFPKKGVYRLGTKTVEMPGGGMEVKTIGPDNKLRLVVTVV